MEEIKMNERLCNALIDKAIFYSIVNILNGGTKSCRIFDQFDNFIKYVLTLILKQLNLSINDVGSILYSENRSTGYDDMFYSWYTIELKLPYNYVYIDYNTFKPKILTFKKMYISIHFFRNCLFSFRIVVDSNKFNSIVFYDFEYAIKMCEKVLSNTNHSKRLESILREILSLLKHDYSSETIRIHLKESNKY